MLECNYSFFQIDTLLLSYDTLYPLEVKNYEGDFIIEGDRWCTVSKRDIKNPINQMERTESLFRQLLQSLGYKFPIQSYLIFINPEFHLYHAPPNPSIIFPAQLTRFLKKLNTKTTKVNQRILTLAEKLIALHTTESPYTKLPPYSYEKLDKGPLCPKCYSLYTNLVDEILSCTNCGFNEDDIDVAILRSVAEYKLLFPERKITTKAIHDWCSIIKSKKTIRRVLSKNFLLVGHGKSAKFVSPVIDN